MMLLRTRCASGHTLVYYNRIPKTGSTTLLEMLQRLAPRAHFSVHLALRNSYYKTNTTELRSAIAALEHQNVVYINHIFFHELAPHVVGPPHTVQYIQMVRNPIHRLVSLYYFSIAPGRARGLGHRALKRIRSLFNSTSPLSRPGGPIPSLEDCLRAANDPDQCLAWDREPNPAEGALTSRMVRYFCGYDPVCLHPESEEAFSLACEHAVHKYAAVGVLERLRQSVWLFRRRLPQFFLGTFETMMRLHANSVKHRGATRYVSAYIREHHRNDFRLYNFLLSRLEKQ